MAGDPTKLYERFEPPERLTLLIEAMARDDEHEAERLQRTCPRKTYTQQDAEFEGRWDMAFDILAVVSIDLRAAWAKLHVLEWVIGNAKDVATGHHVTAGLAFIDGLRCGQGLPQTQFFARPLPEPRVEDEDEAPDAEDDEDEDGWDDEEEEDDDVPLAVQEDRGLRLEAVQKRSEHYTNAAMVLLLHAVGETAQTLVNIWTAYGWFCRTRLGVEPETMMRAWQFPVAEFQETLKHYEQVKPDPAKVEEYTGYIAKQWDRRFRRRPGSEYLTYADVEEEGGDDDGE